MTDYKKIKSRIQILSNTNYALVDVLKSELMDSTKIEIAVAFVRKTGIDELYKSFEYAMQINNAKIEIIAGLDFKTTDLKALLALKEMEENHENFNFYCFGDKRDNYNDLVFHPKIYLFEQASLGNVGFTSILGSSNLTRGGLTTNFEVNSVFKEKYPKYFSQLQAIYKEIKFTDSIFIPSRDYILRYGGVKKEVEKVKTITDKSILSEIENLKKDELKLPGTVPSLKKILITFLKERIEKGSLEVSLSQFYKTIPGLLEKEHLELKMDTLNNSIRGELNKHEKNSNHKDNMHLFKRTRRGFYTLTEIGKHYQGR